MNIHNLFQCSICKNIPDKQRETFLNNLNFSIKTYVKGEPVASQGGIVDALYVLLEGNVKTEMISEAGTVISIARITAPSPLASAFLFARNNRFPVDVIAQDDCEVMLIPKQSVLKQLAENECFLQGYLASNSDRIFFLSERLKSFTIKTIKGKLAQYILQRAKGLQFQLDLNQTELAEYFGVARPSLSRCLSEMVEQNIIELHRKKGAILDIDKLKTLILQQ